jgi:hypothetical protein
MIKEVKMFTLVCDCCGKDVNEGTSYSCWSDENYLHDLADDEDWAKDGDKDYCKSCFEYNDNDELIIKTKEQ